MMATKYGFRSKDSHRPAVWRLAPLLLAGCFGAELRKVHLPDLLEVDAKTAKEARPGEPMAQNQLAARKSVRQLYASFLTPDAMIDGDAATSAVVRDTNSKDQYVLLDFGCICTIRQIEQDHGVAGGFAARYRIDVAGEHNFPYECVWVGCGTPGESIAAFRKARLCRFVRITLLEPGPAPWNIAELTAR